MKNQKLKKKKKKNQNHRQEACFPPLAAEARDCHGGAVGKASRLQKLEKKKEKSIFQCPKLVNQPARQQAFSLKPPAAEEKLPVFPLLRSF